MVEPGITLSAMIDSTLQAVANELRGLDREGARIARVLRNTLDQLYDGQRTGRYRWDQLFKTEKTHCGTLVEINLQREFAFKDGTKLDYLIAEAEVDCKYSQQRNGWMIPPEAFGELCLLICAEDSTDPRWSAGLVRASHKHLNIGANRDRKATLNGRGRNSIVWLFHEARLPGNVLVQLDRETVDRIMALRSGQQRINALFRSAQGSLIGRGVVATVAQQADYMKRIRANGGARTALRREGILILGEYEAHRRIAKALGIPEPGDGELISIRVAPESEGGNGRAPIDGSYWRVALPSDPRMMAPNLPKV